MAVTWGTLGNEIVQEYGYLTTDTNLTAKVLEWEKDAVRTTISHYAWWWLRQVTTTASTTSSQNYITLTAGIGKLVKLWNATYREEIIQVEPRELIEANYDLTLTGRPQYFWVDDFIEGVGSAAAQVKIHLYPVPDATYTITLYHMPFDFGATIDSASTSAIIPVPSNFYHAIKEFVRAKMAEIDGKPQTASMHLQMFYQALDEQVLENQRFTGTRRSRLSVSDIDEDYGMLHPRLDPNHFRN